MYGEMVKYDSDIYHHIITKYHMMDIFIHNIMFIWYIIWYVGFILNVFQTSYEN